MGNFFAQFLDKSKSKSNDDLYDDDELLKGFNIDLLQQAATKNYLKAIRWHGTPDKSQLQFVQQSHRDAIMDRCKYGGIWFFGTHNSGKTALTQHLSMTNTKPRHESIAMDVKYMYQQHKPTWKWHTQILRQRAVSEILLLYRICQRLENINPIKYRKYVLNEHHDIQLQNAIKFLIQWEKPERFNFEPEEREYHTSQREMTETEKQLFKDKENKLVLVCDAIQYVWSLNQIKVCHDYVAYISNI